MYGWALYGVLVILYPLTLYLYVKEDEDALLNKDTEKNKEDNLDIEVCDAFPIPAYCSR